MAAPSPTSGVTGDLQTVVAAQQALTVQIGALIQQLTVGSTALTTSLNAITAALDADVAPNQYFHVGGAGSFLVNTGPTVLYGIALNTIDTSGATFTSMTVYDGVDTAGAYVGNINFVNTDKFDYGEGGLELATGLYVVAYGTPCDLTLIWKAG